MYSADKIHHQIRKCGILDRAEKRLEEIENIGLSVGCVPSVSERFRSKEQGTRGKTRATENPVPRRVFVSSETTRKRLLRILVLSHFHGVHFICILSPPQNFASQLFLLNTACGFLGGMGGGN